MKNEKKIKTQMHGTYVGNQMNAMLRTSCLNLGKMNKGEF